MSQLKQSIQALYHDNNFQTLVNEIERRRMEAQANAVATSEESMWREHKGRHKALADLLALIESVTK